MSDEGFEVCEKPTRFSHLVSRAVRHLADNPTVECVRIKLADLGKYPSSNIRAYAMRERLELATRTDTDYLYIFRKNGAGRD